MERVLIRGLPVDFTAAELGKLCERYGAVFWLKLVTHPQTGRCLGWGFVELDSVAASRMFADLNGLDFQGRTMLVQRATAHDDRLPCRFCQYVDFCDNNRQLELIDACAFSTERRRRSE
jgi:RNA recognition motif-containing protein